MYDYKLLETLLAVVEEGSFEEAGNRLYITQSAVTQRIKLLEELSGQILLSRTQPPTPTESGQVLVEHCRKVNLLEKELNNPLSRNHSLSKIPLAVNSDSIATWFAPVITEYYKRGNAYLEIRREDQDMTQDLLMKGEVMGAISSYSGKIRGCRSWSLGEMVYRFCATRSYVDSYIKGSNISDVVSSIPVLNFSPEDTLILQWLRQTNPKAEPPVLSHYLPSSDGFPHVIGAGSVSGMLTESQFQEYKNQYDLVDLSEDKPIAIPLYWHRWSVESIELNLLTELILKYSEGLK
ncbi:ArgP/LysG family DNA-binding transcriptional regulator [Spirochaeta cellobiosiphila]|uniref:ArgP/LysG family DNA-binding transcriptional regulator n=1 Tax=Spirochaeta cellobiosiphila TaxID=504483 RepID=UPI00040EB7A5|nr:ArgP/LysG family DNA-binding transcriptional regulator [Spirochaeta cellobiosiphila]